MHERGNSLLKFLDFYLGIPLTAPAALFRRLTHPRRETRQKRITILCLGAIGDLLLASALVNGIRELLPTAHIEIVASHANSGALPLLPGLSSSAAFPATRPDLIVRWLRSEKRDVLIDLGQWTRISNLISSLSGAGVTAGFVSEGQFRSLGYDFKICHDANEHELNNFLALGKAIWPTLKGSPRLKYEERPKNNNIAFLHMWPAPGKGRPFKQWPEDSWANLINEFLRRGFSVRLSGSRADATATQRFLEKYFPREHLVSSVAGKFTLTELASEVAASACMVAVNTGIMHLAALTGIPTVALHGATNPRRWGPIGNNAISLSPASGNYGYLDLGFEYPRGVEPAMKNLPVEDVLNALKNLSVF